MNYILAFGTIAFATLVWGFVVFVISLFKPKKYKREGHLKNYLWEYIWGELAKIVPGILLINAVARGLYGDPLNAIVLALLALYFRPDYL